MKKIIFFDGVCHLCNGFVDFIISRDKKQLFFFASLQGQKAKELLNEKEIQQLSSVVLYTAEKKHYQAAAILQILKDLGGGWKVLALFLSLFPERIQNHIYNWIAKNRYNWFGKREVCRIPTPGESSRLLN